jgi:hypothetical protein
LFPAAGSGRRTEYKELEDAIFSWVVKQRVQGLRVTTFELQEKCREIMVQMYADAANHFVIGKSWVARFLDRYGLARVCFQRSKPFRRPSVRQQRHEVVCLPN